MPASDDPRPISRYAAKKRAGLCGTPYDATSPAYEAGAWRNWSPADARTLEAANRGRVSLPITRRHRDFGED